MWSRLIFETPHVDVHERVAPVLLLCTPAGLQIICYARVRIVFGPGCPGATPGAKKHAQMHLTGRAACCSHDVCVCVTLAILWARAGHHL